MSHPYGAPNLETRRLDSLPLLHKRSLWEFDEESEIAELQVGNKVITKQWLKNLLKCFFFSILFICILL